jgi:hypothetical protein
MVRKAIRPFRNGSADLGAMGPRRQGWLGHRRVQCPLLALNGNCLLRCTRLLVTRSGHPGGDDHTRYSDFNHLEFGSSRATRFSNVSLIVGAIQ